MFIDLKGNIIAKQAPIDIKPNMFSGACGNSLTNYKDFTLFFFPYDNSIYKVFKDSRLVTKYFVNYGEKNIPTNLTIGKTYREVNKELKKMDVGILVKFLETDSSVFLYSKYKESGIISIYNKNSQSTLSYIQELNDVNVLFPNSVISTISGDSLIGYWDSFYFTSLKKLYNNIAGDEKKLSQLLRRDLKIFLKANIRQTFLKLLTKLISI